MIKHCIWAILIGLLMSCSNQPAIETKVEAPQSEEKKKEKLSNEEELLTKKTVVERLTAYAQHHADSIIYIKTSLGNITVKLYAQTPLHRANFVRLANRKFYDGTYFHRVVPGFVAQGGGSDVRRKVKVGKYRVPAELFPNKYYHKKGAVAMARYDEDNPDKESDSHEFYLVKGRVHTLAELKAIEKAYAFKFTPEQVKIYTTLGGAPHLDSQYTVFGEVIDGLEIIDQLTSLEVDKRGWPKVDVKMEMKVVNLGM